VQTEHILDLSAFAGITQYDPVELVLTAGAGTSLEEVEALLAEQNQMLAFEPPDYSVLFDVSTSVGKNGTLGGTLAGNISGPRRFLSGAARDHFLGFKAVSGRGEPFKSGGRVVKNVTGFDLSKLMAGSWGTLAALWEVTVKVLPRPEKTRTLLLYDLNPEQANKALISAAGSSHSVSAAAHLPATLSARSAVPYVQNSRATITALRLEGPEPSVSYRLDALKNIFSQENYSMEELHSTNSSLLWREIGNLDLLNDLGLPEDNGRDQIWRLSLAPTSSWQVLSRLIDLGMSDWLIDQAGGALWVACPPQLDGVQLRETLNPFGGHGTLWRPGQADLLSTDVFQPQPAPLAALTQRVKASFDPAGILNPGRMYPGPPSEQV
jgi:glycolate oxidase FAD binding subunit